VSDTRLEATSNCSAMERRPMVSKSNGKAKLRHRLAAYVADVDSLLSTAVSVKEQLRSAGEETGIGGGARQT
jgi:hypothetical protein